MSNPEPIEFGSGNALILCGVYKNKPTLCLKVIQHGEPLGLMAKPIDHNSVDPSALLTFSSKEGLEILTDALFKLLQMYDEVKVYKNPTEIWKESMKGDAA